MSTAKFRRREMIDLLIWVAENNIELTEDVWSISGEDVQPVTAEEHIVDSFLKTRPLDPAEARRNIPDDMDEWCEAHQQYYKDECPDCLDVATKPVEQEKITAQSLGIKIGSIVERVNADDVMSEWEVSGISEDGETISIENDYEYLTIMADDCTLVAEPSPIPASTSSKGEEDTDRLKAVIDSYKIRCRDAEESNESLQQQLIACQQEVNNMAAQRDKLVKDRDMFNRHFEDCQQERDNYKEKWEKAEKDIKALTEQLKPE